MYGVTRVVFRPPGWVTIEREPTGDDEHAAMYPTSDRHQALVTSALASCGFTEVEQSGAFVRQPTGEPQP